MTEARQSGLERCVVVIPVWEPEPQLPELVRELLGQGVGSVVVVDDGGDARNAATFAGMAALQGVVVLRHEVNRGKGRALKTGLGFVLESLPLVEVVVTADGDGQHTVEDIVRVAQEALSKGQVVLGMRSFDETVPLRSRFGNELTRVVFRAVCGIRVGDTQTGLRAFPRGRVPELLLLKGERYEYEMTVMTHLCEGDKPIEIPIETVYLDKNRSSRFKPVRDSVRIYGVLARFLIRRRILGRKD